MKFNQTNGELHRNAKLNNFYVIVIRAEYAAGRRGKAEAWRFKITAPHYNSIGRHESWTRLNPEAMPIADVTAELVAKVWELRKDRVSVKKIAQQLNLKNGTVSGIVHLVRLQHLAPDWAKQNEKFNNCNLKVGELACFHGTALKPEVVGVVEKLEAFEGKLIVTIDGEEFSGHQCNWVPSEQQIKEETEKMKGTWDAPRSAAPGIRQYGSDFQPIG